MEGAGEPVILLHGFGEDGKIWEGQVAFLKKEFLVIVPDIPGSGKSEFLGEDKYGNRSDKNTDDVSQADINTNDNRQHAIGMMDYADAVKAILDHLQISLCSMIGHSMGGYVLLAYANKYPDTLQRMGLFHSTAFADDEQKVNIRKKAKEFVRSNGAHAFLKTTIPNLFGTTFKEQHPEVIENMVKQSASFSSEAIIQYYSAMIGRPDRTSMLRELKIPILYLIGEEDNAIPLQQSLKQCHLPGIACIHILPGVGHMGMLEKGQVCNEYLLEFLRIVC